MKFEKHDELLLCNLVFVTIKPRCWFVVGLVHPVLRSSVQHFSRVCDVSRGEITRAQWILVQGLEHLARRTFVSSYINAHVRPSALADC